MRVNLPKKSVKSRTQSIKMPITVLSPSEDRITIFYYQTLRDYELLKIWSTHLILQGKYSLWISAHSQVYRDMEVSMMIYFDQSNKTPIELAYMLTMLVATEQFDLIILDGCLSDFSTHYPRLRWVLDQYQSYLVILID